MEIGDGSINCFGDWQGYLEKVGKNVRVAKIGYSLLRAETEGYISKVVIQESITIRDVFLGCFVN